MWVVDVDGDGRIGMEGYAMSAMTGEKRVRRWMMRLEWMWVVDERIESTGYNFWSAGKSTSLTTVRWYLVVRSSSTSVTRIGWV